MTACRFLRYVASRSNIRADSERQLSTSYSRFIIMFGLFLTVSELLACVCGPKMRSCRFLRWVASQVKYKGEFWKAAIDFLFAIYYNVWFISYRFRVISLCLWTDIEVMPIS